MPEIKNSPKLLFYDIETAGINGFRGDLAFVICVGFKWAHEKKPFCLTVGEYDGLGKFQDKKLLQAASKILNEADLVITHYGSVFDRRLIQSRLLINNLDPISPTKMKDTCFMARSIGAFSSNRLGHLANVLQLKNRKMEKGKDSICPWPDTWFKVMQGDEKALKNMATYCMQDVLVLEELYDRLKVFDQNHPRLISDRAKCRICGSNVEYRGFAYKLNQKYRRFVCKNRDCRRWDQETTAVKVSAEE